VTADGALLETEEIIPATRTPTAVRLVIMKHFGGDEKLVVAKKTIVVYEIEGKIRGERKELLVLPTGRVIEEPNGDDDDDEADDD
jgi:hypothetical protein